MTCCCALFGIHLCIYSPDRGNASQRTHFKRRTSDTPAANTLFFKGWTIPSFILKCLLSFSPLIPPPSHYFGKIGRHGQPWQHNVQSNILEIHVGVSIAITTLIKASHIVQPEEQYFSLTAKPPSNHLPGSDPVKQDYERSHLRSRQPTPPTPLHTPAATPVCASS